MVKVVGCKPIGSPAVGSNPAHLKKKDFMNFHKNNYFTFFQKKSLTNVNIFASSNDHFKKLNLVYFFIYLNSFLFNFKTVPSNAILKNQKHFFNFLNYCVINNVKITFFSSVSFKNLMKSVNFLFLSSQSVYLSHLFKQTDVVIYLDNKFNNKINAKNAKGLGDTLIIKPISLDAKMDLQVYYLLIDLSNDLNKFLYISLIKSFLLCTKQNLIKSNFKKFFLLKKTFIKLLK